MATGSLGGHPVYPVIRRTGAIPRAKQQGPQLGGAALCVLAFLRHATINSLAWPGVTPGDVLLCITRAVAFADLLEDVFLDQTQDTQNFAEGQVGLMPIAVDHTQQLMVELLGRAYFVSMHVLVVTHSGVCGPT